MHTVRNRLTQTSRKRGKPRPARDDNAFLLRHGAQAPPTFPADLIVPPHRGAVITTAPWPLPAEPSGPVAPMGRKAARRAARRAAALARTAASSPPSTEDLIILAAQADPAGDPPSPSDDSILPVVWCEPECGPALSLPSGADALVEPAPAEIIAGSDVPLPSTRALVPRRQGFIDILAFALRDSGRRLSRWSSARRRADDMKDKLARAEARMRAMEAQLAALQALQERVRNSR
jgi:hypothetical protein